MTNKKEAIARNLVEKGTSENFTIRAFSNLLDKYKKQNVESETDDNE